MTLFALLKSDDIVNSPLFPTVLDGLITFSHLISIDFFADILQVLRRLVRSLPTMFSIEEELAAEAKGAATNGVINDSSNLSPRDEIQLLSSLLLSIRCVFQLLKKQGQFWQVDLSDFHTGLYSSLFYLPEYASSRVIGIAEQKDRVKRREKEEEGEFRKGGRKRGRDTEEHQKTSDKRQDSVVEMALECVELSLIERKQAPPEVVAAFIKRLSIVSLSLEQHETATILTIGMYN